MKTVIRLIGFVLLVASSTSVLGQSYRIDWYTIDAGGGTSSGDNYQLSGTIGQPDATPVTMTGGSYSVQGGFWPGLIVPSTGEAPTLFIQFTAPDNVSISWAPSTPGFQLEQADALGQVPGSWSPAPAGNPVLIPASETTRFYRLKQ